MSLCLEKNILYEDEKEYLLKYTDNVPFKSEEIDYELLDYNKALDFLLMTVKGLIDQK